LSSTQDRDRIEVAREELMKTLQESDLRGVPVLIYANKQDLPQAMHPSELVKEMKLHETSMNPKKWFVQSTTAVTGDGLYEGLDWLSRTVEEVRK